MNVYQTGYAHPAKQATQSKYWQTVGVDFSLEMTAIAAGEEPNAPTLDDVKKEFRSYLDSLPLSPGLARTSISVDITDAAFEKMLADPDYKQKMKDLCARDLCDPNWSKLPPSAISVTIDADSPEEYLASSWNHESHRKNARSDGFWTRRAEKGKANRKAEEKRARERREMMAFLQERADARKYRTGETARHSN